MQTIVGTFATREEACRTIDRLAATGVPRDRLSVLMPGTPPAEVERRVPTDEGEDPGMGAAVGSVVGGAVGLSTAAVVLPGVGPIIVAGLLAAGMAGAAGGAVIGDRVEDVLSNGLPRDHLSEAQAALARGRSVVVASVDDDAAAERVRKVFEATGAESVGPQ
jgi:hypothetical protein